MSLSAHDGAQVRTRVKFCGMTRESDVRLACELDVDAIGLIFAEHSSRRLDLDHARALRDKVSASVSIVALIMDNTTVEIARVIERMRPDVLQFHGGEDDVFCASFGLPFLKAIAMRGVTAEAVPTLLARYPSAAGFVFDGHAPGAMGGGGERFNWNHLSDLRIDRPWLLAGGLDAGNVAQAIHAAQPWGVDVSSGIESAPGIKDHAAMRAFAGAVRTAERG